MKYVFVTGGSGFVGQRLVHSLASDQCSLRLLSRAKQIDYETVVCDLEHEIIPEDALHGIDTVFHLAGFAHDLRDAKEVERLYTAVNVNATISLAELAANSGVQRFVFVSSVKAGGAALNGKCMTEFDQRVPEGVYGKTKREAELAVLEIGKRSGMHVSIIRPTLVYGAGVKGNLLKMLTAIEKGRFPPLPDTKNIRSMVYVDDLVSAILLSAKDDRANGQIFIVSDNQSYSSRMIYESMCVALGKKVPGWRVSRFVFVMVAKMGNLLNKFVSFPFDSYRFQKLLGDECFSSEKIRSRLDFRSNNTLYEALPDMVLSLRKYMELP